jgi:putative flippase GtrA
MRYNDPFVVKLFKFIIVGGSTTLLYMFLVIAGVEWGAMEPIFAITISFSIIFVISFILNKIWVFDSADAWKTSLLKFVLVSFSGFILNLAITYLLVNILSCWYVFALVTTVVVIPFYTFFLNNLWTFRSDKHVLKSEK